MKFLSEGTKKEKKKVENLKKNLNNNNNKKYCEFSYVKVEEQK